MAASEMSFSLEVTDRLETLLLLPPLLVTPAAVVQVQGQIQSGIMPQHPQLALLQREVGQVEMGGHHLGVPEALAHSQVVAAVAVGRLRRQLLEVEALAELDELDYLILYLNLLKA